MTRTIELRGGERMPALGLGTWKSAPGVVGAAVKEALRLGYRHLDCAAIYGNEAEIGASLAECFDEGLVKRDELFITSKLWNTHHAADDVGPALEKTLSDLRLERLDLYLMHWPVAIRKGVPMPEAPKDLISLDELPVEVTWRAMEALVDDGRIRHIGVSNFSAAKVEALMGVARIAPVMNQVELHPYLQQAELVERCQAHEVAVTAYSPLGSRDRAPSMKGKDEPVLLEDPLIGAIAARHEASPAQVLIAWALQRDTSVIPKSVNPERMKENLAATELELTPEDMAEIAQLDRARRYVTGAFWVVEGGAYTLANLWDE